MNNIIDGRILSEKIRKNIKEKIEKDKMVPSLVVIQIGDDAASSIYIKNKKKACENVGIKFSHILFNSEMSQDVIINEIKRLNEDISVNGIIVQLPIPKTFDVAKIINTISPVKDVDGLTYENVGNLVLENECIVPSTALGIITILDEYKIDLRRKNVCVIGRSNLVGKPLIQLLLQKDATVSICHSKTNNLKQYTKMADVLIVAVGCPNLITKDMVKENSVIIDVGINKEGNSLKGDVDFVNVRKKAKYITPVPGGVGPITVSCLLINVLKAYEIQNRK